MGQVGGSSSFGFGPSTPAAEATGVAGDGTRVLAGTASVMPSATGADDSFPIPNNGSGFTERDIIITGVILAVLAILLVGMVVRNAVRVTRRPSGQSLSGDANALNMRLLPEASLERVTVIGNTALFVLKTSGDSDEMESLRAEQGWFPDNFDWTEQEVLRFFNQLSDLNDDGFSELQHRFIQNLRLIGQLLSGTERNEAVAVLSRLISTQLNLGDP